ncbi:hypothetical protein, partial [Nocardia brasiliensis]|uniref:hypothetical protein n=1 Tax=Nocardia brasiliensis TaxID=37326 RepID=UPI0024544FD5
PYESRELPHDPAGEQMAQRVLQAMSAPEVQASIMASPFAAVSVLKAAIVRIAYASAVGEPAPSATPTNPQSMARTGPGGLARTGRFDGARFAQAWKVLGAILQPCADSARQIAATPNRA